MPLRESRKSRLRSPRRTEFAVLLALGLAGPFVLGVTSGASPVSTNLISQRSSFSVGITRCTFVDRSRPVLDYATAPPSRLSSERTLVTEIRYPALTTPGSGAEVSGARPAPRVGGYPTIVFAHGYDVTPDTYAPLLDAWARAGFVVVAPFFPDESKAEVDRQHGANTEDDLTNEPADLTFVTRQVLSDSASAFSSCPGVRGLVLASELAVAGQSDGGNAVGLLSYSHGSDPQGVSFQRLRAGLDYRATIVMSGQEIGTRPYASLPPSPALLVVQSAADRCNSSGLALELYGDVHQADKWFLELRTAHHLPPFDGADLPAFKVVTATTVRFLQTTLEGATPATDLYSYGNSNPPVARIFHGGYGPAIAPLTSSHLCGLT